MMAMATSDRAKTAAQFVLAALAKIDNGASINRITDYVSQEFPLNENNYRHLIRRAIDRGVAFGAIKKVRNKYALSDIVHQVREFKRARSSRGRGNTVKRSKKRNTRRNRKPKYIHQPY